MSSNAHVPVLLGPVLEGLDIKQDGCYVDGTFGRGGHSGEILKRLNAKGRLIGIDRDPDAIASAPASLTDDPRFELVRGELAELQNIIGERKLTGKVDGLLLDLGVSSPQLDEARRGFSFLRDGPLDMRMDPDTGTPASDWLASVDERELIHVLRAYGEETFAKRIARAIVPNHRFARRCNWHRWLKPPCRPKRAHKKGIPPRRHFRQFGLQSTMSLVSCRQYCGSQSQC